MEWSAIAGTSEWHMPCTTTSVMVIGHRYAPREAARNYARTFELAAIRQDLTPSLLRLDATLTMARRRLHRGDLTPAHWEASLDEALVSQRALVDAVRDMSSSGSETEERSLDLAEAVMSAVAIVHDVVARCASLAIEVRARPEVAAPRFELRRLLLCLLANALAAVEASPGSDHRILVTVFTEDRNRATVTVEDSRDACELACPALLRKATELGGGLELQSDLGGPTLATLTLPAVR